MEEDSPSVPSLVGTPEQLDRITTSLIPTPSPLHAVGSDSLIMSSKRKKKSFGRFLRSFSSGIRRRSSDDSTASAQSNQETLSGGSGSLQIPITINEQSILSKEEIELALRNQQIEQAASERDEKRKRRVKEALFSMHRRLDVAFNAIQAEMDETLEVSKWNMKEKKLAGSLVAGHLLLGYLNLWFFSFFTCLGLMGYSLRKSKERSKDAAHASDNVAARLEDLEDGLRRCELALQHDLEAEEEWEKEMEDERRAWEERQRELLVRRGRVMTMRSLNTRRKKFVEQIQQIRSQVPDVKETVEKARSLLDPKNFSYRANRNRTLSRLTESMEDLEPDDGASPAWIKYVQTYLPLERAMDETDEEKQYHAFLNQKTNNKFERLHPDLRLMILRGYVDKKDRFKESNDAIEYILEWRSHCKADDMLKSANEDARVFFHAWPTQFGGEDRYGHLVVYDRVDDLDLPTLFTLSDDNVLIQRTKQLEVLRRLKKHTSDRRGFRVCKHVYILDLHGLSLKKHFQNRVKNLLSGIFKVGGDGYPDCLWSLWLINTPFVFQVIWKFISPGIDPTVKSKIKMLGGRDKYIPEMEKHGIPKSCVPIELGGEHSSTNLWEALNEFISQGDEPCSRPATEEDGPLVEQTIV